MIETINFALNGKPVEIAVEGNRSLLWVLRTDLGLTGTKYGCGEAVCGACTVIVDNNPVRSCAYPVREVSGSKVITIEGLLKNGKLHPIQEAFIKHDALQCGYCTPGMIINAYSLLLNNPQPDRDEIIFAMNDNLCRCGAYNRIIDAIKSASKIMKGGMPQIA